MNVRFSIPFLGLLLTGYFSLVKGQTLTVTILSSPSFTVNSVSGYTNGLTVSNTTVKTFINQNKGWRLTVQASGANLLNGTSSIPVSQLQMQVTNATPASLEKPLITLSNTPQTIVANATTIDATRTNSININYTLKGGANLLQPSGNYATTLTFTMALY